MKYDGDQTRDVKLYLRLEDKGGTVIRRQLINSTQVTSLPTLSVYPYYTWL